MVVSVPNGKCAKCDGVLDGSHKTYCRTCMNQYAREWRASHPGQAANAIRKYQTNHPEAFKASKRKWILKTTYGLTVEQFERMVDEHDGKCAICKVELTAGKGGSSLCIDHDHTTGDVRGLLCSNHNFAIGHFGDDPALLLAAVEYLNRYARPNQEVM